jgi:CBS domain-containing protein
MTTNVISIPAQATILEAARMMLRNRISGLPVVDAQGRLIGMVTEGDFLRRSEIGTERQRPRWLEFLLGPGRMAEDYVRAAGRKVEDVMTRDPVAVSEDDDLQTMVELMERRRVKRLPVLRNGKIIGIVSRANLMRARPPAATRPCANASSRPLPSSPGRRTSISWSRTRLPSCGAPLPTSASGKPVSSSPRMSPACAPCTIT